MSEKDIDKIEPVDFNVEESPLFSEQANQSKPNKNPVWVWAALGGLGLLALLVIFVLPTIVSEYELPLERRVELAVTDSSEPAVNSVTAISPFEEAQKSLQRKEAQDVLAALLVKQAELDDLAVEKWGLADYEDALENASIGDDYYRVQDFDLAQGSYSKGDTGLQALLDSVPVVATQTLIEAQRAFESGDAVNALALYDLVLLLNPESEEASIGLQRSYTLEEVNTLIASADDLFDDGELQQAQDIYRQVVSLDGFNEAARGRVDEISAMQIENEFSRIMSVGYQLLGDGNPTQAIAEFEKAANLGVNREQAVAAITQTENEIANAEINQLRSLISSAEIDEHWQSAEDEYNKVLIIDPNLIFAIEGRDYANKRARLDLLLVEAVDNPERFAEDAVFEQTRDVYFTGRAIENPGSRLSGQLNELQALLENSQVPIDIRLVSDNLTDVTLLRVGSLGLFEQTALSLKPGRYVAVGKRTGYREVRQEFTVGFGLTPDVVVVQCDEQIVATSRR